MRIEASSLIDPTLLPLIAESRAFYAQRRPGRGPSTHRELVRIRQATPAPVGCEPSPSVETVSADGRSVRARIHMPVAQPAAGVILEVHAGGFYLGSAAGSDRRNRRLVDALGAAVVSVDYRLAPED